MRAGLNCSRETVATKINLIVPAQYVMTTAILERTDGLSVHNQTMTIIKEKIERNRDVFSVLLLI